MAETAERTADGWRLRPGTECTGNTFSKLLITHCGGKAFLVNDVGCGHNTICDGQFVDNAEGGLFQAAPNLVTMRPAEAHSQMTPPATTARSLHEVTGDAAARAAHSAL